MELKDYVRVKSGTLEVKYPWSIIFGSSFALLLEGEDIVAAPGKELEKVLGTHEVLFDRISAKMHIKPDKSIFFEYLDAESKTIQFHLGMKS